MSRFLHLPESTTQSKLVMILVRTTLVIGAGASAHLDFPTGERLTPQILELAKGMNDDLRNALGFAQEKCQEFYVKFRDAGQPSIDRFLERQQEQEMVRLGKTLIAMALVPYENPDALSRHRTQPGTYRNWYEDLFQAMRPNDGTDFFANRLAIVTFNYDRSLEHYLATAIFNSGYADTYEHALGRLESLCIFHFHGQLGRLKLEPRERYRPYSTTVTPEILTRCAEDIRVTHEWHPHLQNMRSLHVYARLARKNLENSERIIFLGFGYDDTNLENLGWLASRPKAARIEGTWKGIGRVSAERISQKYHIEMPAYGDANVEEFLGETLPLDHSPVD